MFGVIANSSGPMDKIAGLPFGAGIKIATLLVAMYLEHNTEILYHI